ncbi:MAG: leucine-rich repeat domain-containing protein [Muribaculaceae bacterium]|nr:leucine-rich repeat domain-containing protein [Muribaculaceae bacterium]
MKKKLLFILTIFTSLSAMAEVEVGDVFQYGNIWYEWVSKTEVRTQAEDLVITKLDQWNIEYDNGNKSGGPNKPGWGGEVLEIPEIVYDENNDNKEATVIAIGKYSFACKSSYDTNLRSIKLPSSVTKLEEGAFCGIGLTSLDAPGITEVGAYAIAKNSITTFQFENLETIGKYAFFGCEFTELTIGSNLISIGDYAFSTCGSLATLTIDTEKEIPSTAFDNCYGLKELVLGTSVTKIADNAYKINDVYNEHSFSTVTILGENVTIGKSAFQNCSNTELLFGENASVISVGDNAFNGCSSLKTFPFDNLETIGDYAFSGCGFTELTIGSNLSSIGNGAFSNCGSLTTVTIDTEKAIPNNVFENCTNWNTIIFGKSVTNIPEGICKNKDSITTVVIEGTDVIIGKEAFSGSGISSIDLKGVARVEEYAFAYCSKLEELTIDGNVSIGDYAFAGSSIKSVTIDADITEIPENAFAECNNWNKIIFGESVTNIPNGICKDKTSIQTVEFKGENIIIGDEAFYGSGITSIDLTNVSKIGDYAFAYCPLFANLPEDQRKLVIPDGMTEIGNGAFYNCSNISSLEIPGSVEIIGNKAFAGNVSLKELTLNEGLKIIGESAFDTEAPDKTPQLENVIIPGSVERIEDRAFCNQSKVSSLIFLGDDKLEYIGDYAFYASTSSPIKSIYIPNSVTTIGAYAFHQCQQATEIIIGDNVKTIGDYAFYNCKEVKCLTIPNSVEEIGDYTFWSCQNMAPGCFHLGKGIKSIGKEAFFNGSKILAFELPATLETIGEGAFDIQCDYVLTDVNCNAITPPTIHKDAFGKKFNNDDSENSATAFGYYIYRMVCLHVPKGSGDLYRAEYLKRDENGAVEVGTEDDGEFNPWSQFDCIIEDILDTADKSIGDMEEISYAFVRPGETINLNDYINLNGMEVGTDESGNPYRKEWAFPNPNTNKGIIDFTNTEKREIKNELKIELNSDGTDTQDVYVETHTIDAENGQIVANKFGQVIVEARVYEGNMVINKGQQTVEVPTVKGAVAVFVCPTIRVIYSNTKSETENGDEPVSGPSEKPKYSAPIVTYDDDTNTGSIGSVEDLSDAYATYEHRVVYNSLPKVQVQTPADIQIEEIARAEGDGNGAFSNLTTTGVTYADTDVLDPSSERHVVPVDPITTDRVIAVYTTTAVSETVGVKEVELSTGVTVVTDGRVIEIRGAAEDSEVTIVNLNGVVIYRGTQKVIPVPAQGVYIATVENSAFKLSVK